MFARPDLISKGVFQNGVCSCCSGSERCFKIVFVRAGVILKGVSK